METEETVETVEGILVRTTEVGLGNSDDVTTIKGERAVGERD